MFFPDPTLQYSITPLLQSPAGLRRSDALNGWNDLNCLNEFFRLCLWQTKIT